MHLAPATADHAPANPVIHRVFAVIITIAAAFVAWLGFAQPKRMDEAFTWAQLPPLHAAFVGALYLFGAVLVGGSAVARHRAQWGAIIAGIAIFTTSMLVLTVLNTEAFDWSLGPVKAWVVSYVVYPPIAWILTFWLARLPIVSSGGASIARPTRLLLVAVAVVFGVSGIALVTARETMARAWPWPVSNGVAQFYGGPFLAVAWVAWWYARRDHRADLVVYAPAVAVLAVAVLATSIDHRDLFGADDPAAWLWFAVFGALAASHAWLSVSSWRAAAASRGGLSVASSSR